MYKLSKIIKYITIIVILSIFIYNIYNIFSILYGQLNNKTENFPIAYSVEYSDDDDDNDNIKYSKSRYVRSNRKRAPKQY